MVRLACTVDGTALIGDDAGFVPLAAADPSLETLADAVATLPDGLPDPMAATAEPTPASQLRFGLPLPRVGKLWGIGLNYAAHAADLDEERPTAPASFMKPASALCGPGGPIRLPPRELSDRVTAEGELAVVIGRTCRSVDRDAVSDVIAGYVPVIDMTAEDVLRQNPRFLTRAKSFDTFLVVGPWLVTPDEVGALDDVAVRTVVNDVVEAENTIDRMLFPPDELVSFHSDVMTLEPGDLVSTGTPGAHVIEPGDHVRAAVDRVGSVEAPVIR